MKKKIYIALIFGGLLLSVGGMFFKQEKQKSVPKVSPIWESSRLLPERIAMNSYLSGSIAHRNHDLFQAVKSYKKVLEKDPQNSKVLENVYLLAMLQGIPEEVTSYVSQIQNDTLYVDYFLMVEDFKQEKFDVLLNRLKHKKMRPVDHFLIPLVKAWVYARQEKTQEAFLETEKLKDIPFISGYQKILLGEYLKKEEFVRQGIQQMGDNSLLAVGYFPLLKKTISEVENWEKSALHKKYLELSKEYPVTADLLDQIGQEELDATKALAEVFYLTSATGGNGKISRDEALILNSLSLLLQPDKQMSLVWGAELVEELDLPKVALSYYQRLKFHSATIGFKVAANMMKIKKTDEALKILENLKMTNQDSVPLLTLLAQAYRDKNQNEAAISVYNRLIPLLEKDSKNVPLVQAYVSRGVLYGFYDKEKMLADLKHAQMLDPENAMLLNDLGYHQLEQGLIDEGFEMVQRAYLKQPNDPYILDSVAFGYWKKGQPHAALPLAERALDLMPQSALINTHLGDIYSALGRRREAAFQYKKALDLKVDLSEALAQELTQKLKGDNS